MNELVALLKRYELTISSCESITAGLFSATMASIPSTSTVLCGGVVTYMTRIKEEVVGVEPNIIKQHGVISAECAISMASHIRSLMNCDIGISCTGNAGPTVMEGKPVGCVYIGMNYQGKSYVRELILEGDRNTIREKTVSCMCKLVIDVLTNEGE